MASASEIWKSLIKDYGATIFVAIAVALVIRFFVIEAYRIPGASMKPNLEPGDMIFVSKMTFGVRMPWSDTPFTSPRAPQLGEVVVYTHPSDPPRDSLRRVLGLPGDTIEIKNGLLFVNGKNLKVDQSTNATCGQEKIAELTYAVCWEPPLLENFGPEKVPPGSVFLMGDFRSQSTETKKFKNYAIVPQTTLKGKALWVWLSLEPPGIRVRDNWFSRIRFERMFREIQ